MPSCDACLDGNGRRQESSNKNDNDWQRIIGFPNYLISRRHGIKTTTGRKMAMCKKTMRYKLYGKNNKVAYFSKAELLNIVYGDEACEDGEDGKDEE
jgi:hypothetical protein